MESPDHAKIFVGGISLDIGEETLRDHFSHYGDVVESVVMKDRNTGSTRGLGFVLFSDSASADKALQDKHVISGRTVDVKRAVPKGDQQQHNGTNRTKSNKNNGQNNMNNGSSSGQCRTKKIFVGGLPSNLTEEEFRAYFEKFGTITDVVVMYDSVTHRPRGFGFITFDSEGAVDNVMQKNFHELNDKLVEVKRAVPKDGNLGNHHGNNNARMAGVRRGYMYSYNFSGGIYSSYGPWYGVFPGYIPSPPYANYGNGRLGVYPTPIAGAFSSNGGYGAGYPFGNYGGIPPQTAGYGAGFVNAPQVGAPRSPWDGMGSSRQCSGSFANPVYAYASSTSPAYMKDNRFANADSHDSLGIPLNSNGKSKHANEDQKATGGSSIALETDAEGGEMDESLSSHVENGGAAGEQNQEGLDTLYQLYPDHVG